LEDESRDLQPLFEQIVESIPAPKELRNDSLQLLVANLDYNDYVGRLAIGRIFSGEIKIGDQIAVVKPDRALHKVKVSQLYAFEGLKREPVEKAGFGEIVALAGIENINIGDTITSPDNPHPLPAIAVDEPTIAMIFGVNNSPFAGREGKYVTSRQLKERLDKEILGNVADPSRRALSSPDQFKVSGTRRIAVGDPDRDDAPRRLRASGVEAGSDHAKSRRPNCSNRSRPSSSTVPTSSSASSLKHSDVAKGQMTKMVNHGTGPRASRVRDSVTRADRVSQRVSDLRRRGRDL
jgi:GTP-binding protein